MAIEGPEEAGIDKQKIIREVAQGETPPPAVSSGETASPGTAPVLAPGSRWETIRAHADEIGSMVVGLAAIVWIAAGFLWQQPVPLVVGGIFLLAGGVAWLQSVQNHRR